MGQLYLYPCLCIFLGGTWIARGQKIKQLQASQGLLPTTYAAAPDGAAPVVQAQAVGGK